MDRTVDAHEHAMDLIADLERSAQKHRVVANHGEHIVWRCFGEGTPLVLLHGGHGSWLHWVRNIGALADHHAVWVPDLPGYGESATPAEPTLEPLVDALGESLNQLVGADTSIDLAGFSFGGLVAASLSQSRGAVSSLALLGPAGHGGSRRPRGELRNWQKVAAQGNQVALLEAMRHNLLMHMLHTKDSVDEAALHIHTQACMNTRFRSKPISRLGLLPGILTGSGGLLLLAWGEHDVTVDPLQAAHVLAQGQHGCQTHIVAGAGHWVQYEAADEVNTLLLDWLRSVPQPSNQEH